MPRRNVKAAIEEARACVAGPYHCEAITNIGLEEIQFDDYAETRLITIGFLREWPDPENNGGLPPFAYRHGRTFKLVTIADHDGETLSMTHWPAEDPSADSGFCTRPSTRPTGRDPFPAPGRGFFRHRRAPHPKTPSFAALAATVAPGAAISAPTR